MCVGFLGVPCCEVCVCVCVSILGVLCTLPGKVCLITHTYSRRLPIIHLHITNNGVFVALHAHTPLFSFFTAGARMYTRMHTGGICRLSSMLGLRLLLQFMPCIDSSPALGFGFY